MDSGFNPGLVLWTLVPFVFLGFMAYLAWRLVRALARRKGATGSTKPNSSQEGNHA